MEVSVLQSGAYISITDGTICRLAAYDGTGLPPHHLIVDRGPYQHGENYLDFRLDPREVTLVFVVKNISKSTLETTIRSLQSLFKPHGTMTMQFVTDSGDTRYLSGNYVDGLKLNHAVADGNYYKIPLVFRAHAPTFYALPVGNTAYQLGSGGDTFAVPTPVPTGVGVSTADVTQAVVYAGTWRTYPIVVIGGPITSPVITNLSTGDKLDLTGVAVAAGTSYTIDCRYGHKTVVNNSGTNKISDLTSDSDLATFNFMPSPEVIDGNNSIRITGTSINTNTAIEFWYDMLYAYL